jgi:hypothetical protein
MTNPTIQPTSDHDLLIRLDVKLQRVSDDIQDLKEGISLRLSSVEKQVTDNSQWIHDFKLTWKVLIGIASVCGGVVGFVISVIFQFLKLTNK